MTPINEIDSHFVSCIGYLHASSKLRKGDPVPLQYLLEEAIKNKYGIVKDYSDLVQSCLKPKEEIFTPIVVSAASFEETKGSNSDDELELDLLKEDLMCVICNGMDVGARNRLVECSDCHCLYHQECHKPGITEDSFDNWVCFNCTEIKRLKLAASNNNPVLPSSGSNSPPKTTPPSQQHSTSNSGSSYKNLSCSSSKPIDKCSRPKIVQTSSRSVLRVTSINSSSSNISSRISFSPNMTIISADKRIQIMKKKAATKLLQEKRKLPR